MSSENKKKISKEELEKKIVELEGKLSYLSSMLGNESVTPLTPSMLKKNPPPERPLIRISESEPPSYERPKFRDYIEDYKKTYLNRLDQKRLDYEKAITEEKKQSKQDGTMPRGTMPKGFGVDPKSPFSLIMSYDKKNAKAILKSKRCLGCKKFLDKHHIILCHECANNKMTEQEFKQVIRRFTTWGFYKKSFFTNIALKLKLAKVITEEEKHE